jgi:DNA-binding NarL/FixJ family response regulator
MSESLTPADIRVLIVDDQQLMRAGFRIILESEPGIEVVGEAGNGEQAVAQARALAPDVICMDVQMPGMDGLEATRLIVADPTLAASVLVLTTFNREDYLFSALQSGASGFLLKNASPEELVNAVQVLARGDALLSPDVTRHVIAAAVSKGATATTPLSEPVEFPAGGDESSETAEHRLRVPGLPESGLPPFAPLRGALTEREAEVLQLLACGLSNAEIASRLYVGESTVKTHVSKVLMKLELRDRIQAVIFAYEHGITAAHRA